MYKICKKKFWADSRVLRCKLKLVLSKLFSDGLGRGLFIPIDSVFSVVSLCQSVVISCLLNSKWHVWPKGCFAFMIIMLFFSSVLISDTGDHHLMEIIIVWSDCRDLFVAIQIG